MRGQLRLTFDHEALEGLGVAALVRAELADAAGELHAESSVHTRPRQDTAFSGKISTENAIQLIGPDERVTIAGIVVRFIQGTPSIAASATRSSSIEPLGQPLSLRDAHVQYDEVANRLLLSAELVGTDELAEALGLSGQFRAGAIDLDLRGGSLPNLEISPLQQTTESTVAGAIGPDVIVGDLYELQNWGSSGSMTALTVGTISCNAGDARLNWYSNTNQHPVIAQNMYRLANGRFEQIGLSWLKHGFFALSGNLCYSNCQPTNGSQLGIHCSDPYSAALNGSQANLGPRWQVNASTGAFTYPPADPAYSGVLARRIQVSNSDLATPGAMYFVEGHYVSPDDAAAGNQNNNASYRPFNVLNGSAPFILELSGFTRRRDPAIKAWRANDPFVVETAIQVPDEGLFMLAAKVTDLGNNTWNYEYALQNLNSHRSGKAFAIPLDPGGTVSGIGFHDVNYHSGEPFDGTDWPASVGSGKIEWSTTDFSINQNANALRWGTLYNFRFVTNRPPQQTTAELTLFRPGTPTSVFASTVGPLTSSVDCNNNGVADILDVQNGTSEDCDGDVVPDECENFPLAAIPVAQGLNQPVFAASPPADPRLFILEQGGIIRILSGATLLPTPFLDISGKVSQGTERGLLSIAFSPNYAGNGYFYAFYTNLVGDSVVSRFQVSADANVANGQSEVILKTISQDFATHNGGQIAFGPDGFLYAGLGDGGGLNDAFNRAQDTSSLLGKLLRLDVNSPPEYVPASNPFIGPGLPLDEIWALGTRNPWRFSFDRETGDLYLTDNGASTREEINIRPAGTLGGQNYGWRCMEGTTCTGLSGCTCNAPALTVPTFEYSHIGGRCAITGGYVYRGCALPNLDGAYLYADYCSGEIWALRYANGAVTENLEISGELAPEGGPITSIISFAENADGELFIISHEGTVYRIVPDPEGGAECGNGVLEPGEHCDDGNTDFGDGCDENCVAETGPPNDRCPKAILVGDGTYGFDNAGANTDGPNDSDVCFVNDDAFGSDMWYCYTAPCSGTVTADLCNSGFDTILGVYDGCACPAGPSASACNNDGCSAQSVVSFEAAACESYLLRVAGFYGSQGAGVLNITCDPDPVLSDCDGNNIEDVDDIRCGTHNDGNGNLIPDICETDGDFIRGGRLYDNWWVEAAVSEPASDHPLWQYRPDALSNPATGAVTWRCKECHGWDYKGVDGQYGAGSHRTGFPGILGTNLAAGDIFNLLKDAPDPPQPSGMRGHDYGSVLSDTRINDLVAFVLAGAIDDAPYINTPSGAFLGDPAQGLNNYTGGTQPSCDVCHGANGANINFGTPSNPEFVGTVATENPWEFLHKIRFAAPAAPMPSWLSTGGSNAGAADIGRYVQLNLPTDCTGNAHCDDAIACTSDSCDTAGKCQHAPQHATCADDGLFCTGSEACDPASGCESLGNPCTLPSACDEQDQTCGCQSPIVVAKGPRYLAITPQPAAAQTPMALVVTQACGGNARFVGAPSGPHNIATLVDDPGNAAYLTPAQWGGTVYLTGADIVPAHTYLVQADCGIPGQPVATSTALATTNVWGDVIGTTSHTPDGVASARDIAAVVDGARALPWALPVYTLDLFGCTPNRRIDAIDIAGAVDAVRGFSFHAGALCPDPCN